MKWDIAVSNNGEQYYSDSTELATTEHDISSYAYLLPGYSLLDGTFQNTPDRIPTGNGYISAQLSGADGGFTEKPVITIDFDRLKTSRGLNFIFNSVSGDYVSDLSIEWYKDGELVESKNFSPTGSEYFCSAQVTLFNTIKITLNATSRPYRYAWIALIQSRRLTDAGGLKIVYDDIALGAKESAEYTVSDNGHLDDLSETYEFPDVALNLPQYSLLNGDYRNSDTLEDIGYMSKEISDGDGVFQNSPVLTATFPEKYSSVGLTLTFNDYSEDYCSELEIVWYRDNGEIARETFYPDSYQFFCYLPVEFFDKIEITFKKTSKPYRNVFLTDIYYGLERIFKDDEAKNVDCILEVSPISEELSINTLNFTVRSKTDYAFNFQKRQQIRLYFDEAIIGVFYLSTGKRESKTDYYVESEDAVGLLDKSNFKGGIYNGVTAQSLIDSIFEGEDIEYFVDETVAGKTLSGYLPVCTKREALAQVAFAIGAEVNTAYDMRLYIYPRKTEQSGEFTTSTTMSGLSIDHSEVVTGIRLYVHDYVPIEESEELYNETLNGTAEVEFSEPHHDLQITGGTITAQGSNYAEITGTGGNVTLTGKKYDHRENVILKENPNISRNKNIYEVKDATLVTASNAQEVLDRVYEYYQNNESVSCRVLMDEEQLGDVVEVDTDFDGKRVGTITKVEPTFTRTMTAEVTIK